ncbi:MAG TPA: hypothetical protein VN317_06980, partial [Candidatus Methanoperedens sp.]|nr:hypothetical protein [Candidatus Methanoperedens sp.]
FLRAGMRSDPADPSLELAMAVNLERQGRRQEALNMYQEYEENSRSDPRGTEFARQRREALGR